MPQTIRARKVVGLIFTDLLGSDKYIRMALEERGFDVEIQFPQQCELEKTLRVVRDELLKSVQGGKHVIAMIETLPTAYGFVTLHMNELAAELYDLGVPVMRWAVGHYDDQVPAHLQRDWVLSVDGMSEGPLDWAPKLDEYRFR